MIDEFLILRVERLRDEVTELRSQLRRHYKKPGAQVQASDLTALAARIGEAWMVEVVTHEDVRAVIGGPTFADLNIEFQRLLTYSDHATLRKKYDKALDAILKDFRARVLIPLKQFRGRQPTAMPAAAASSPAISQVKTLFVGHSFAEEDRHLTSQVIRSLDAMGLTVVTGEKPKADHVSAKIRERIDACDAFVGVFSRKDKLTGKPEWTTSAWVVDEKAYALAKGKKLVLIKEVGVASIGGIQGDYEYLEFDRSDVAELIIRLTQIFRA